MAAVMGCYLLGAATVLAWDGQRSSESLDYREALRVMTDTSAPLERRHAAAGSVYRLSLEAARVFAKAGTSVEVQAGEFQIWRAKLIDEWSR